MRSRVSTVLCLYCLYVTYVFHFSNYYEGPDYKGNSKRNDEKIRVEDIEDVSCVASRV